MRPPHSTSTAAAMNGSANSNNNELVGGVGGGDLHSDANNRQQPPLATKVPLAERELNNENSTTNDNLHHSNNNNNNHIHHNNAHHNHHHSHHAHPHHHHSHHSHHHHSHNPKIIEQTNNNNANNESSETVLAKYLVKSTFAENYEVEHDLGKGRYAVVRRCRCRKSGLQYAAKVLRKARLHLSREAIVQEIAIQHRACRMHPRIAKLLQVFEAPRDLILVMEYAAGGELWQPLAHRGCGLHESIVRRVLVQLLDVLAHLHANGIIHCDINPHNILLSRPFYDHPDYQPDIRLCDFGLARAITAGQEVREIRGTLEYVAPEVLLFDPIGPWSDMWSVGVLAYVLLSGYSPFAGMTKEETLLNISRASVLPTCHADVDDDVASPALFGLFPSLSSANSDDDDNSSDSSSASVSNWASVGARDFISRLLIRNPRMRPSALECLHSPWLQDEIAENTLGCLFVDSKEICDILNCCDDVVNNKTTPSNLAVPPVQLQPQVA